MSIQVSSSSPICVLCELVIVALVLGALALRYWPSLRTLLAISAKNKDLLAHGEEADAIVVSMQKTGKVINNLPEVNITLEVQPATRPPFQTQLTVPVMNFQIGVFPPGTQVKVKYDPNDTSKVAIASGPANMFGPVNSAYGMTGQKGATPAEVGWLQQLAKPGVSTSASIGAAESAQATIVNKWDLEPDSGNARVRLQLEVQPADRPSFQAEVVTTVSAESLSIYQPGSLIRVKFDPNDTSVVVLEDAEN